LVQIELYKQAHQKSVKNCASAEI